MTEARAADFESNLARLEEELKAVQQELALRNAEYQRIASYDTLTGLLNRRGLLHRQLRLGARPGPTSGRLKRGHGRLSL